MNPEWDTAGGLLTDANDLFDLNAGGVDFFGEFAHGLVGVLVCERVHIDPHPCGWMDGEREREREINASTHNSAGKNTTNRRHLFSIHATLFFLFASSC